MTDAGSDHGPPSASVSIPDVRDYHRVNADLARLLDAGHLLVRLEGAEGQRRLVAGLRGGWRAVVEVFGKAGPELASGLDAPGLTVVASGDAGDGAGLGLAAGLIVVLGDAGPCVGYAQRGGAVVVRGSAGPRAGLEQSGGVLALLGTVGPLAGERQSGGLVYARGGVGPHAGRGKRGGRFLATPPGGPDPGTDPDADPLLRDALARAGRWLSAGGAIGRDAGGRAADILG